MTPSMTFSNRQAAGRRSVSAAAGVVHVSFNVPFNSNLAGPEKEDVLYSSRGAFHRWTHPDGAEDQPAHALPVHRNNVERLRFLCQELSGENLTATTTSSKPKPVPGMQLRGPLTALVTNVCLSGSEEVVRETRAKILQKMPITLRCETVDVDRDILCPKGLGGIRVDMLDQIDTIAAKTTADIFLLECKARRREPEPDQSLDKRLQLQVYGDIDSAENAKTRLLILIDQLLMRHVDSFRIELTLQNLVCGRHRRNVKLIEAATDTAIYFPPLFPGVFCGPVTGIEQLRTRDEIIITGDDVDSILQAKKRLHELLLAIKTPFVKDVQLTALKADHVLLERLDMIRKIVDANGSYVLLPPLGKGSGLLRVQATDMLTVERTVREIMGLAGHFYSAAWWMTLLDAGQRQPTPADVRTMLPDICINSGAELVFEQLAFHVSGSDDAVKAALSIINTMPFLKKAQSSLRVKLELANEHKEFVSGKKNGKINKIMSQSNVQIVFDGFNEYNFYIDVCGSTYEATRNGLELVELEMPASISFHVPDQYHKRIIGIGGQHIQRIMKKYSVFVKFSNAMDRGGIGKEDDDIKVDNVICRTPARNADNLELVKQEIMDMVAQVDAEFTSESIPVDRLYHRELITRHKHEIEELEKKWNCKVTFPGTEQASDIVTVSGPEYQVPQAVDVFLGMVRESHEIEFPSSESLRSYLSSPEFLFEHARKVKECYVVKVEPQHEAPGVEKIVFKYTRNNAGGLKDAIDFVLLPLIARGLDANSVKGYIPEPKTDPFQESMPYFESKLLQRAEPPIGTDSPTRASFPPMTTPASVEDIAGPMRQIFDKFRRPGSVSSLSSFLNGRRRNGSTSPGSMFIHASQNASKASIMSSESRDSGYLYCPWADEDEPVSISGSATTQRSTRPHTSSTSSLGGGSSSSLFPNGLGRNGNASTTSLNAPILPGLGIAPSRPTNVTGNVTPKIEES
ncbi:hypothetical protein K470DRAFT_230146 [Piedraia hortae CBS 480.64]|uniref:K Homology domain-containing protein n=1 Tax=Piedraia hortae CBS 480.64 TaxID=1314780 RepID=A0A6A7C2X9_9PEZI|nr:hypothetical protein K470DRAFT_230146 [Piedraia hortae CBS 480.64]